MAWRLGSKVKIKGEGQSPFTAVRAKAQLFHVAVARGVERARSRTAQLRAKLL